MPTHALVDGPHPVDGCLGVVGGAVGGRPQEVGRALQPPPRVVPIVAVVGHTGHRQRMQRLEQERPQPTDEHRTVGVDALDRRSFLEPSFGTGGVDLRVAFGGVGADDPIAYLHGEPCSQVFARGHHSMVTRNNYARLACRRILPS